MDDDGDWIFYGHGSTHDLSDRETYSTTPRLAGLRSVSKAAAQAMHKEPRMRAPRRRPIGFRIPK